MNQLVLEISTKKQKTPQRGQHTFMFCDRCKVEHSMLDRHLMPDNRCALCIHIYQKPKINCWTNIVGTRFS